MCLWNCGEKKKRVRTAHRNELGNSLKKSGFIETSSNASPIASIKSVMLLVPEKKPKTGGMAYVAKKLSGVCEKLKSE